ncbi:hypothetical protein KJ673_04155 [Patescibacteria group bacterium]|nr:hypothetical protein [Patescibacteria group bacterium]MCG2687227.1 hypothetical protein [Candidatus Parcubacteria bacterium]
MAYGPFEGADMIGNLLVVLAVCAAFVILFVATVVQLVVMGVCFHVNFVEQERPAWMSACLYHVGNVVGMIFVSGYYSLWTIVPAGFIGAVMVYLAFEAKAIWF